MEKYDMKQHQCTYNAAANHNHLITERLLWELQEWYIKLHPVLSN